jgi:hypothetical protein
MATKRNKKRYQRHEKPRVLITFTGRIFLKHRDEEEDIAAQAQKGDFLFHPSVEALHTIRRGEYGIPGYAGYFRVDVHDGHRWHPVILQELFTENEHHFRKTECPIDTFAYCCVCLKEKGAIVLQRKYREHYELAVIVVTSDLYVNCHSSLSCH